MGQEDVLKLLARHNDIPRSLIYVLIPEISKPAIDKSLEKLKGQGLIDVSLHIITEVRIRRRI